VPELPVPEGLGAAGAALWAAITGDVAEGWALDERDRALLRRACSLEDAIVALEAAVAMDGPTTTGSRGQVRVHPAVPELRQLALAQKALLAAVETEDPAAKIAGERERAAERSARWRRQAAASRVLGRAAPAGWPEDEDGERRSRVRAV